MMIAVVRGGLDGAWLPGTCPVGWWSGVQVVHTSNVEVGQTTYPINRRRVGTAGIEDKVTKRGREGRSGNWGGGP